MTKTKQIAKPKSKEDLANELAVEKLLPEINANHRECIKCGKDAIQHAIQAGELLAKLKKSVKHGDWLALLEARCDCSARCATNYIRIAANLPELIKSQGKEFVADATVDGCIKLLGHSKTEPQKDSNRQSLPISNAPTTAGGNGKQRQKTTPQYVDPVEAACEHDFDDEACRKCHAPKPVKKISGGVTFDRDELTSESKDAFDKDAPDELKHVFELREGFEEQRNRLAAVQTWITQNENHPGAKHLQSAASRIRTDLKQASSELKFCAPHCVCVYCKNKPPKVANCNACKGLGWITEPIFNQAPEALKRESKRST